MNENYISLSLAPFFFNVNSKKERSYNKNIIKLYYDRVKPFTCGSTCNS